MSTGGSFWDGSVFTPGFGVYSTSTSNQNKRNVGYNNSLNEGGNYSTTLGANFSTVVLGNFSTTAGVSMSSVVGANLPNTEGGKVELIIPYSVKWTRGLYDYDFKSCTTQIKAGFGKTTNLYTDTSLSAEQKVAKAAKEKTEFIAKLDEWVAAKNFVAKDRVDKVVSDQQTLGTRVEQVANSDTKTVVGTHTINAASHSIQSTAGAFVKLSLGVTVKGLNITLAGNVVNIG
jgi:hypothetical protein